MISPDSLVPEVRHDVAGRRFEILVDGHRSELTYTRQDGRITFTHTFVPPALRGRGLAERLVRAALDWARIEGELVEPACSYVARFMESHAEYHDLLAS
jgi:predicted GNAT family acetyltransferase